MTSVAVDKYCSFTQSLRQCTFTGIYYFFSDSYSSHAVDLQFQYTNASIQGIRVMWQLPYTTFSSGYVSIALLPYWLPVADYP